MVSKGELLLIITTSDVLYDHYRKQVLAQGGRLRRAEGKGSAMRHLQVYAPDVIYIDHLHTDITELVQHITGLGHADKLSRI